MIPASYHAPFRRGEPVVYIALDGTVMVGHVKAQRWLAGFQQWNIAIKNHRLGYIFEYPADRVITFRDYLAGNTIRGGKHEKRPHRS